jgi:hypothetical protein
MNKRENENIDFLSMTIKYCNIISILLYSVYIITLAEDVASLFPSLLKVIQLMAASWAFISMGLFAVLAKSMRITWPDLRLK